MAEENIQTTEVNTEPTGVVNAGAETKPSTPNFDEMLKQGGYQAEFDRRVSKAIETAKGKFTDPKVAELEQKLTGYMQRESVTRAGVRPEFLEFVTYSVNAVLRTKVKTPKNTKFSGVLNGADDRIRTGDLILTKDALYRLSYISASRLTRD